MDSRGARCVRELVAPAVWILILVCTASGTVAKPDAEESAPKTDASKIEALAKEEPKEQDPSALSKTPLGQALKWDAEACKQGLKGIENRMLELRKGQHAIFRKEYQAKTEARTRNQLPPECKKLAEEIREIKKQLDVKTRELSKYMDNLDSVKKIRKERDELNEEWKRLTDLRNVVRRRLIELESKKKGTANTRKPAEASPAPGS